MPIQAFLSENVACYTANKSASSLQEKVPPPNGAAKTALYLDNAYWAGGHA